ncbi:hypothetical protein SAMD00023353_8300130 [Rosellinia necatrix]|uniref:Uncharacterized protein n=1 Tax=Rosellinia necatrix TaxID=77044 RepID=A0A1W2TUY5_ROSNE|nr:hypothetical protein SAMD00023353_8300130 [Rosellinia necatrix]
MGMHETNETKTARWKRELPNPRTSQTWDIRENPISQTPPSTSTSTSTLLLCDRTKGERNLGRIAGQVSSPPSRLETHCSDVWAG